VYACAGAALTLRGTLCCSVDDGGVLAATKAFNEAGPGSMSITLFSPSS
jgi:hypothetical protein